ncbi:MAG: hypothetical protein IKJ91_10325 [Clostridia bacterium]|nr:hypothetical protein [Clostridia bacterium]
MKNYENFDNSFFIKLICIIGAIALLFVVATVVIGVVTGDSSPNEKDGTAETFIFGNTDAVPTPNTKEADTESEETTLPIVTETDAISEEITTEPEEIVTEPVLEEPLPTVLAESEDMGEKYIDSLIFLGDATSYGLKSYGILKDGKDSNQLWFAKGATLSIADILTKKIVYPESGKEMLIADAAALAKPEYLVVTLGAEGLRAITEEDFVSQYTSLVDALISASPETKLILQSIFPVNEKISKLTNEKIDIANEHILKIAEEKGVRFLDTRSVLKDENGGLIEKLDNGGTGMNLTAEGFEIVLNYIRTHGYK